MELDWCCTGVLGVKQQSCYGVLLFSKRPKVSPLEKQRNRQHDIWCLITNTWANRVAIVSSVITKIFNPCKYWMVTTQPSVYMFSESVFVLIHCQFSVIIHLLFNFNSLLFCFCSIHSVWLFSVQLFVSQCIFWFWYWNCIPGILIPYLQTTIQQSINIHQTAPSFVLV